MKTCQFRLWMFFLGFALLVAGCKTVPVTGRKQLNFVPAGQVAQMSLAEFDKMKQEVPINKDPAVNALVQKVGRSIAAVAQKDLPNAQWEFVVFESKEANAFCLPGGKVGVYTGILPYTKNEGGLATVLGHEIAHAAANHGAERISEQLALQTGGQLVSAALASKSAATQQMVSTAYGLGAQLGRELPHSRKQESEADHIGLIYMAQAGYNPGEALEFWKRFSAAEGSSGAPWFLRTHPVTTQRIKDLEAEMPQAMAEFQKIGAGKK